MNRYCFSNYVISLKENVCSGQFFTEITNQKVNFHGLLIIWLYLGRNLPDFG